MVYCTDDGLYKTESETGEVDITDPNFRKLRVLGENRFEAFSEFRADAELFDEVSEKINTLLENPENMANWASYRGANRTKYGLEFIDRTTPEFRLTEVQNQCKAEISIL